MGGKSSKSGTNVKSPNMGAMPNAPRIGVSAGDMDSYNAELSAYNKQQKQISDFKNTPWRKVEGDILAKPTKPSGKTSADLIRETTMGVNNAYGSSTPVQNEDGTWTMTNELSGGVGDLFNKAFAEDAGQGYSDALLSKSLNMVAPAMANRGLPAGSEINDKAYMDSAMSAILGGQQMVNADRGVAMAAADRASGGQRGDVMGGYSMELGANMAPWMQEINRQNLIYGNEAANVRQGAANAAGNKSSKMNAASNVGTAYMGM